MGASVEFIGSIYQQLIRMSFFKRVKENTDEKFHHYLPDSEHSQNDLVFVHLPQEKSSENDNPDAALIMDRLNSKETPANIRELLMNKSDLQASGQQLKEIFLECVFSRTRKSLEHLKRFVEVFYTEVFEPWFVNNQ